MWPNITHHKSAGSIPLKNLRSIPAAIIALLAVSLSCDSSTGPGSGPDASLSLSSVTVSSSSIVADGKSTAQVTVSLRDANGAAIAKSGGTVSLATTRGMVGPVTDQNNGTYTATLTSSTVAGAATVSATLAGAPLTSTASITFVSGAAAAIAVANSASNNQTAVVGATVPNPPSVRITDANGNGVANVAVSFAVTSGGGAVTGATQTTNDAGIATVGSWRLGNVAGTNTLTATVSGAAIRGEQVMALADLVISFTATATPGAPGSISINGGDNQTAVAGTQVSAAPSIKVVDANNNPVSGATVNFFVGSGGGSITGATTATNASGIATVGSWTLGTTAGPNTLTAGAVGVTGSVTISATGVPGAPAAIAIANPASNNQSVPAGNAVAVAPSVKVTDANGNGVAGVAVTFAVGSGGGSITGGNATTDASGVASVGSWTLGTTAGPNTLTATSGSLNGSPVTFTATATSGAAGSLTIVAGNGQSAVAGTAVSTAPSVKVSDANGNAVQGATVTFAVATGGGSVTGATATTDATGVATVGSWILGTTAGSNSLTASVASLQTVTFTATGTAGAAALISINAGNNQTATVGTVVAIAPSVKVTDANGNIVSGASVTFAIASGGGSITGASATTGANGVATVGSWNLGPSAGTNTLTATLNGVSGQSVTFTATGSALAPLVLSVTGRLERSETVAVTVTQDGTTLSPSAFTLALNPADGGTVNVDGTVKLLKTGQLTITATAGSRNGSAIVNVAQPPLIVFDLVRNFTRQIWQVAIDGGDLVQLTKNGSDNQHGSRVGSKLVYAGARNGRSFDLFSLQMSSTDSVETQLTNTTYADRDPNLSPSGGRITYVSNESGIDRAIYANADGSSPSFVDDISSNTGAIEISPSWSPGSDKVVLSSTASGTPDIWIANTLGATATKLPAPVNTSSAEVNPVWNAAGKIAFHTSRSGADEIWVTDVSGSAASKVTDGASPAWLADGRIVFVRYSGSAGSLYWVDPANPSAVKAINVGGGDAQRPSAVR